MVRDPDTGLVGMASRALRRRCPRCGTAGIFRTFGELTVRCRGCGFRFERESGYWVGAMIINTAVTFLFLFAVLIGGMLLTWPDVPWTGLFVATLAVTGLTPVLFHPLSRTLWMAIELSYHPLEQAEIEAAREHTET